MFRNIQPPIEVDFGHFLGRKALLIDYELEIFNRPSKSTSDTFWDEKRYLSISNGEENFFHDKVRNYKPGQSLVWSEFLQYRRTIHELATEERMDNLHGLSQN